MNEEVTTTESDVALDIVAALDMYAGTCGSEETTIKLVGPGERDSIVIELSNGDTYRLQVRRVTT